MAKRYPKEVKHEAGRLSELPDRTAVSVARELDINVETLYSLRRKYKKHGDDAFPGQGNLTPEQAEIAQLKKRVRRLEQERAILKKAVSIFADKERA